jgi:hypothetical protein
MQIFKILSLLFFVQSLQSQTISGKLIDADSKNPIPYAHITISDVVGVVSNEEGYFSMHLNENFKNETVQISALGYETLKISVKDFNSEMEILMKTTDLVLDEVIVGNFNNPNLIINKYVENAQKNHFFDQQRMLCFTRRKETFLPKELNIELLKISYQDKNQFQKQINDFTSKFKNQKAKSFEEHLMEVHFMGKAKKVNPLKALKLNDENGLDMDNFQDKFILNTFSTLKSPYTYRIKTGVIPLEKEVSIDEIIASEKELDTLSKKDFRVFEIYGLITHLEFIKKQDLYDYTLLGIKNIQGMSCYHISFVPSRNKGKYKGNLFINMDDFALIRYEYALHEDKKEFGLNLKFLLGVKVNTFASSEVAQFAPTKNGSYYRIFNRKEMSNYAYIHRSLTMTENNPKRSERKKLKMDFEFEVISESIEEMVVLEMENIAEEEIKDLKTNEFVLYETKYKYDPNFWQPYNVLQATKEIKQFDSNLLD